MAEVKLDDRPITGIWWADGEAGHCIGRQSVTRIDVCYVAGQMAPVPWLEVYKGDKCVERVNVAFVQCVDYA